VLPATHRSERNFASGFLDGIATWNIRIRSQEPGARGYGGGTDSPRKHRGQKFGSSGVQEFTSQKADEVTALCEAGTPNFKLRTGVRHKGTESTKDRNGFRVGAPRTAKR